MSGLSVPCTVGFSAHGPMAPSSGCPPRPPSSCLPHTRRPLCPPGSEPGEPEAGLPRPGRHTQHRQCAEGQSLIVTPLSCPLSAYLSISPAPVLTSFPPPETLAGGGLRPVGALTWPRGWRRGLASAPKLERHPPAWHASRPPEAVSQAVEQMLLSLLRAWGVRCGAAGPASGRPLASAPTLLLPSDSPGRLGRGALWAQRAWDRARGRGSLRPPEWSGWDRAPATVGRTGWSSCGSPRDHGWRGGPALPAGGGDAGWEACASHSSPRS